MSLVTKIRTHFLDLIDLLTPPGDALTGRLRAQTSLMALHAGTFRDPDLDLDLAAGEAERRAAAVRADPAQVDR